MINKPSTLEQYFEKLRRMNRPAWVKYAEQYWRFLIAGDAQPDWQKTGLQYRRYAAEIEQDLFYYKESHARSLSPEQCR